MGNRVFFPQAALDQWVVDGVVDLQQSELTILPPASAERRRYALVEAVRVVREVAGAGDAHGLVGRVKPRAHLEQLGAEIVEGSMLLGDAAFDVEPGWLGAPADPPPGEGRGEAGAGREEERLARFVAATTSNEAR